MRAVWQRLSEQKHLSEKQKAFVTVTEKVTWAHKINAELIQNTYGNFFKNETHDGRTIIPEAIWKMHEENAQKHIKPELYKKRGNFRLNIYTFQLKLGKNTKKL